MTNLEALKGLYEKLGGQAWTAQTISEGIAQVTEVAGGSTPAEKFTLHITGTQGNYELTETAAEIDEAVLEGKQFEVSVLGSYVLPASIGVSEYGEKIPYIPPVYWGENDAEQIFIVPNDGQYEVYAFAL